MHDPLTGLPVRWVFLEQLTHALARLARHPGRVAVLFLDLDGLKYVNDTYGHLAGDRLIRPASPRIRAALRPTDVLARIGGDEFVVLLEDLASPDAAAAVAQRILAGSPRPTGRTARHGAVRQHRHRPHRARDSAAALIAHADTAMYAAKHAGRGRFEVFDPPSTPPPGTSANRARGPRARPRRRPPTTSSRCTTSRSSTSRPRPRWSHCQPHAPARPSGRGRGAGPVGAPAPGAADRGGLRRAGGATGLVARARRVGAASACPSSPPGTRSSGRRAARVFVNLSVASSDRACVGQVAACSPGGDRRDPGHLEITETGCSPSWAAARAVAGLAAWAAPGDRRLRLGLLLPEPPGRGPRPTLKVDQSFTQPSPPRGRGPVVPPRSARAAPAPHGGGGGRRGRRDGWSCCARLRFTLRAGLPPRLARSPPSSSPHSSSARRGRDRATRLPRASAWADPCQPGYRGSMTPEELARNTAARSAAVRRRQEHLRGQLRDTAARIAETEQRGAELYDELAATRPHRAARLHEMAEGARQFAEHERRQAQDDPPVD